MSLLSLKYTDKISKNIIDKIKSNKLKDYKPSIDINIPLENQNLERKTFAILAMFTLDYWCENEEIKKEIQEDFLSNDKRK